MPLNRSLYDFACTGGVEGVSPLQNALKSSFTKNTQMQVAIIDDPVAVMVAYNYGFSVCWRYLRDIKICRTETLWACFAYNITGRAFCRWQVAAQGRRMVWFAD